MLGLGIWENGLSPCGHHSTLTGDKSNFFTFEEEKCGVCASFAQYQRMVASRDESAMKPYGDNPKPEVKRPGDGRRLWVRQLSPWEVMARQASRESVALGRGEQ